jgi:hypothetical protein
LLSQQTRQVLGAGQHPEDRELGQSAAMHAGRGGEQHPPELSGGQARGPHLGATAGGHGLDPAQAGIAPDGRRQGSRPRIRNPIQDVCLAQQLIERGLLFAGPPEVRITLMVPGKPLRRQQRIVDQQIHRRVDIRQQVTQPRLQWGGDGDLDG